MVLNNGHQDSSIHEGSLIPVHILLIFILPMDDSIHRGMRGLERGIRNTNLCIGHRSDYADSYQERQRQRPTQEDEFGDFNYDFYAPRTSQRKHASPPHAPSPPSSPPPPQSATPPPSPTVPSHTGSQSHSTNNTVPSSPQSTKEPPQSPAKHPPQSPAMEPQQSPTKRTQAIGSRTRSHDKAADTPKIEENIATTIDVEGAVQIASSVTVVGIRYGPGWEPYVC